MPNVFISYVKADLPIAKEITDELVAHGVNVRLDAKVLVAGEEFGPQIMDIISETDAVILLLSEHSTRSKWVEREVELAISQQKTVLPVLLDDKARDNLVWPLVSDRNAFTLRNRTQIRSLVHDILRWVSAKDKRTVDVSKSDERTVPDKEVAIATATDVHRIELTIDRDFDAYTEEDQKRLLEAIRNLLSVDRAFSVKVVRRDKG